MITQQEKQEIETIVKGLIREKVSSKLTDADIKDRGVAKFDVIESYLTDIISLGYNNNSIELASNDIMELQSQMPWTSINKTDVFKRVTLSAKQFPNEINCFIAMIKSLSVGVDKQVIINEVKIVLYN